MFLINWYRNNYKMWKIVQNGPIFCRATGRLPSETYYKYPAPSTFGGRIVLNLGCGKTVYRAANVINADVVALDGINLVLTDNKIALESESVDFIIANHVLEHIPDWFETFKELARVLKPGGTLEVWIPPISSDTAFSYRDHINRIGYLSFAGCASMLAPGNNALAGEQFKEVGDVAKLELIQQAKRPIVKWWTMLAWPLLLSFMADHLRNVVSEEQYLFKKVQNAAH